ncbi:MAG: glycosyltransferase family 2 protein [Planctomycetota bacterium]
MSQTHQDLYLEPAKPLAEHELPRLSIIILNWNGRHHLDGCFESLGAADYPREKLDVICVDNGSDDGSQAHLKAKHAWVRLIQNPRNLGFAGGCNVGVANADQPDILVFLNNDLRIEPDFFRNLVAPIVRGQVQAAGGLMYAWDGKTVDSAGGGMNFHGFGIQYGLRKPFGPEFERPRWTLFACGGAMAMDAKVYADLGGFDNRFFAYYEDVDLGWRSWVQGYQTCYVPSALLPPPVEHSRRVPPERLRLLQVRNPMLACLKNYDEANSRGSSRRCWPGHAPLVPGEWTWRRRWRLPHREHAGSAQGRSLAGTARQAAQGPRPPPTDRPHRRRRPVRDQRRDRRLEPLDGRALRAAGPPQTLR